MSAEEKSRRACTLLKVGRGQPARPMVEQRPLFSYWAILMPHFRGVLIPPQNRPDESIQWAWTEAEQDAPVTSNELATIRKRLTVAQQSLVEALEDAAGQSPKAATFRATKERMEEIVNALVALPDAALAGFVARTDRGMLLHSWGLTNPLPVQHLDADLEIRGRVIVGGRPASGHKVLLEASGGRKVGEATTDEGGCFDFEKIAPGSYRVRAVSRPPEVVFAENGQELELSSSSITTVEIRNEDSSLRAASIPSGTPSGRHPWRIVSGIAALLTIAAYSLWSGQAGFSNSSSASEHSAWKVNVAPRSVAQQTAPAPEDDGGGAHQARGGAAVSPQSTLPAQRPDMTESEAPLHGRSRSKNIIAAKQTSGLPSQQAGTPAAGAGIGGAVGGSSAPAAAVGGQIGGSGSGLGGGRATGSGGASTIASSASAMGPDPSSVVRVDASFVFSTSGTVPPPSPDGSRPPQAAPSSRPNSTKKVASAPTSTADRRLAGDIGADEVSADSLPDTARAVAEANSAKAASVASAPVANEASDTDIPNDHQKSERDEQRDVMRDTPLPEEAVNPPMLQIVDAGGLTATRVPQAQPSLEPRTALRASPWRRLLVGDAIVPTLPTRAGKNDTMNELGSRILAEKRSAMPDAIRAARVITGLRVEFSGSFAGALARWIVVDGHEPFVASVDDGAAEIGWDEGAPEATYALESAGGQRIVRVTVDAQGGVGVSTVEALAHWFWVGVDTGAVGAQLDWQVRGNASMPSSWAKDDRWMDGRGRRLDLKWSSLQPESTLALLALVDAASGWSLASKIELQRASQK